MINALRSQLWQSLQASMFDAADSRPLEFEIKFELNITVESVTYTNTHVQRTHVQHATVHLTQRTPTVAQRSSTDHQIMLLLLLMLLMLLATDATLLHSAHGWLLSAPATPSRRVIDVRRAVCGQPQSNWHEQSVMFH